MKVDEQTKDKQRELSYVLDRPDFEQTKHMLT